MVEVERITKVTAGGQAQNQRQQSTNTQRSTSAGSSSTNRQSTYVNYSYFPSGGYKGFIDLGISFGISDNNNYWDFRDNKFEFTTSHGYLFSPRLFVGLGIGINYYIDNLDDDYYPLDHDYRFEVPIFAHVRTHFLDKRVSPFADAKLGYIVNNDNGIYFSPSVGCRFASSYRSAFWVSLGFSVIRYDDSRGRYGSNHDREAFNVRIGWDF